MTKATQSTEVLDPTAPSEAEGTEESRPATGTVDLEAEVSEGGSAETVGTGRRRRLSVSVRALVVGVLIAALVVGVAVLAWLYVGAERDLDAQSRRSDDTAHAERIALDYATNAAAMNFQDLTGWKDRLVAGTSPELKDKLSKAADQMEQILAPLQWDSTSEPLAAKLRSSTGGVYVVDSFVSVLTKTAQSSEPLQSTATYSVTIDSNNDWQITDVGGIGTAVAGR